MTHNSFSDFDFEKKKLSHKVYRIITAFLYRYVLARNLFLSSYFEYVMFWSLHITTKEVYARYTFWQNFNIQLSTSSLCFFGARPFNQYILVKSID